VVLTFSAANEGAWGNNLRVDIDHETEDPATFNVYVRRYDDEGANILVEESFLNLSTETNSDWLRSRTTLPMQYLSPFRHRPARSVPTSQA
jgi:hypothetical protein